MGINNWMFIWSYIVQPLLFAGLFLINVIIVIITIRTEKREILRNSKDILDNAKHITENYEALKKLTKNI